MHLHMLGADRCIRVVFFAVPVTECDRLGVRKITNHHSPSETSSSQASARSMFRGHGSLPSVLYLQRDISTLDASKEPVSLCKAWASINIDGKLSSSIFLVIRNAAFLRCFIIFPDNEISELVLFFNVN